MYEHIGVTLENQIFEIQLKREDKRNALNWEMMEEIGRAIDEAEKAYNEGEARVLFLTASGRAFSSGIDLQDFQAYIERYGEKWADNLFPITRILQDIHNKIEHCSLPTICIMQGYCLGMAFEMALACDIRIAANRTKFSLPETRLGIVPDVGGTVRLVKLVGPARAKELIMTGRNFDTTIAESWGIINYAVPKAELMDKAHALAEELKLSAPMAVNYAKRIVNDIMDNQRGLQVEAWAQAQLFRTEDFNKGVEAMLTKQYPIEWKGK